MVSIDKDLLLSYISQNDVVYQMADELMEVLHHDDTLQLERLKSFIVGSTIVGDSSEKSPLKSIGFEEITEWSTIDDLLIYLSDDLVICIPKIDITLITKTK